jgi:hypothetical protein
MITGRHLHSAHTAPTQRMATATMTKPVTNNHPLTHLAVIYAKPRARTAASG